MVRQYIQVTDEQRSELVRLIHKNKYSIARASKTTKIPYDNAKAINRTYMKEERIRKINYSQRYQTRKKNYGRKRNQPTIANDKKVNLDHKDSDSDGHSSDEVFKPDDSKLRRSMKAQVFKSENDLVGQLKKPNQEQLRTLVTTTSISNSSKKTKRSELEKIKENQFMREMGLQDVDMNVLDEKDSEERVIDSSNSSKNLLHDSRFETRSLEIPFKYGLGQIQQTNYLQPHDNQAQKSMKIFQNTDHDQSSTKFKQVQVASETQIQMNCSSSKTPKFVEMDQTPKFKNETVSNQNQPFILSRNLNIKSNSSENSVNIEQHQDGAKSISTTQAKLKKAPVRTISNSLIEAFKTSQLSPKAQIENEKNDMCQSSYQGQRNQPKNFNFQQTPNFDQLVAKYKMQYQQKSKLQSDNTQGDQTSLNAKELLKHMEEQTNPLSHMTENLQLNIPLLNCLNGNQNTIDTQSVENLIKRKLSNSVLNSRILQTPDSMRPIRRQTSGIDINHIIEKMKKAGHKVGSDQSPTSTDSVMTSLTALNAQNIYSPIMAGQNPIQPQELISKKSIQALDNQLSMNLPAAKIGSPKTFYPSPTVINNELQNIKIIKSMKTQMLPVSLKDSHNQKMLGKLNRLKANTCRATQVLINKSNTNSKFVIVSAEGIQDLIRNQQMLIDLIHESLQIKQ